MFPAIAISFGIIIDESVDKHFIDKEKSSRARRALILKWFVVGFMLTNSYKSVLRANMININYEKTIETIEDMLESNLNLTMSGDTILPTLLKLDPRKTVKELKNKVHYYNFTKEGKIPDSVEEG